MPGKSAPSWDTKSSSSRIQRALGFPRSSVFWGKYWTLLEIRLASSYNRGEEVFFMDGCSKKNPYFFCITKIPRECPLRKGWEQSASARRVPKLKLPRRLEWYMQTTRRTRRKSYGSGMGMIPHASLGSRRFRRMGIVLPSSKARFEK